VLLPFNVSDMFEKLRSIPPNVLTWVSRLSLPALALIGVFIAAGVGAGGYYAYQTYDYVQHNNQFCLSCHLMAEPYQRFARSAHRGLGCKACHQPTIITRSEMALTQIVEQPKQLAVHAEVPNSRCEACHVKGDPKKWDIIKNSAGHKAHLESKDPRLKGLQCVECHSTSLHEFSPSDETCTQAGCHTHKNIVLGKMADLTIHCVACHGFTKPVPASDNPQQAMAALAPNANECLTCHAMRKLVNMPTPDPHKGSCASCHNPHTQHTPHDAVESCTKAGCHTQVDTLTPFHRGMEPGVLEDCTNCHVAHSFKVDGTKCVACHQNIQRDNPNVPVPSPNGISHDTVHIRGIPEKISAAATATSSGSPYAHVEGLGVGLGGLPPALQQQTAAQQQGPRFLHSQHKTVSCLRCHDDKKSHGGLKVTTLQDCRSCHHTPPVSDSCTRCHTAADMPTRTFQEVRAVHFSVGQARQRTFTFSHKPHEAIECGRCHTEGLARSAASVDCDACHAKHHEVDDNCMSCHQQPPASAHPVAEAHVTCTGSGCHKPPPFAGVPRTRQVCLVCHQQQVNHNPGRECSDCHALPPARTGGSGGS
jgi:nitrate/TMAO reductase-like tetraheme cytochrome c subunit